MALSTLKPLAFLGAALLSASVAACAIEETDQVETQALQASATEIQSVAGPGDRMPSGRKLGTRSAVVAPNAAAATAHPLATQIALDIMKDGGNAVDAAIAANAMLGLVEPTGNGIGGDLFALVWDPETERLYGYNGSGRSPMSATLADMQAAADRFEEGEEIPPFGAAPVSVPGTVDGWFALHDRFGSLSMSENLQPTIDYALNGAPIPEVIAFYWGRNESRLAEAHESGMLEEFENARTTFFDPTPREGSLFRNPGLANTLTEISENGRDAFYEGSLARTMDAYMERIGGFISYEDLAAHEGEWIEPVCVTYRDEVRLCELGPNTQGVAALQMLEMLERFDLRSMGWGSADALMAQVESKRLAFADRALGYADPEFSKVSPDWYVREGYNAARGEQIDLSTPVADVSTELPEVDVKLQDGDTTYLSVTDSNGMMVSLIQSNYRGMGSGLVPDGLGFMLQDRGQLFSLDPNHPNVFEPGKRPFHTIIPGFAYKNVEGEYQPWLTFGLMGGGMQPQGHVQIILNLVDFDMGLQEAGDAARWEHRGGCEPTDDLSGSGCSTELGTIWVESGIPADALAELERRGHTIRCCQANGGGYQAIMRDFESGAWIAATEMRKDGNADGY